MSKHGVFTKWIRLVIAAIIATPVAMTAFGGGTVVQAAVVSAVDDAGPDDEPGQKDLNALSVDYGVPGADEIDVTWNWDDTETTGANTRDGCALFDTDGDGFANYSLCLTVDSDETTQTASLYECTADSRADRCGGPTEISTFLSTATAEEPAGSDPFAADPAHSDNNDCDNDADCLTVDTVATADIRLSDFGDPDLATLINVCSYPSREPNSDPSDCVFEPNNGFLTIVKTVDDATTDAFVFDASANASNGDHQWTINGAGSVQTISYAPTLTLDLNEAIPADWNLASASCEIQTLSGEPTGTPTATGIDNFEIRSGLVTVCTFDNVKKQAGVTLQKVWVDGKTGDTAELTLTRPGATDSAISTAPDAPVAGNSANVSVLAGQTVNLSEDLGAASANYTSIFSCTGATNTPTVAPDNRSATLLISAADAQAAITCTFTNTRKGADLTVSKVWQNAKVGDAVDITTTGGTNNVDFAATAGQANETDTTPAPTKVFAGETLVFDEDFTTGDPAAYDTTFECTGAADTVETDGLTIAPADSAITCTFTNARRPVQVVVAKELSPADDAGLFDLSINGVTKVTNGGDGATSAADPVTVFVGDSVSVSEAASAGSPALANYTSLLACDNLITLSPNTGTSGSFTVPSSLASNTTITCTFSNTRKQATFTLNKDWGNADAGEIVNLAASASSPGPIGSPIAHPSTAPNDSGASMTVYSGQTVSFSEAFAVPENGDNYLTSLSCTPSAGVTPGPLDRSGTLVVGSNPVDVTCTFVNTLKQGGVIVEKEWVDGRLGDSAELSATLDGQTFEDTSFAPDAPVVSGDENVDNVVSVAAFAGDTVTFSETLNPEAAGLYTTAWECTDDAETSGTGTSGAVTITPADAGQDPVVCTITNTRKSATIQLVKDWDGSPETDDEVRLEIGTGGVNTALNGADGTPDDFATAQVLVGQSYPISETFTSGDAANYNSSWSCNNADDSEGPGLSGAVAIGADDADATVVCTFLNARKTMTLELQKAWVNGHDGDTAELAIDGINDDSATSTATSTFGTVTDTTNVVTVTAYAGETSTLSEIVTPGANYTSALDCGAHAIVYSAGARTGTIAITPADEASTVTCTYTNTRKSATLTVEKTWDDPVGGPSVTLAASGGLSAGLTGTTTSTSPTNLVAPGAPTMTIFAGETITVSESFADAVTAGMFDTTLSCASPATVGATVSGEITVGSDPVDTTCTFDNVRKSATLTLQKVWIDGHQDDNVELSIEGTGPIATATAVVPDGGGDGPSASTASHTVYAGESVLLSEIFDPDNVGTYTIIGFGCDDGTPDAWAPGSDNNRELELTNGDDVADAITCTITNKRNASTLTLEKVWDDPAGGPALVILDAAGNDPFAADHDSTQSGSPVGQSITIDVLSGETVTVSEAFDLTGDNLGAENYATTLDCTGLEQLVGEYQRTVTIADDPAPVTCTFTNVRRSTTLTLQKAWVKPADGDQVTLSISGTDSDTSGPVVAPLTTETASVTVYAGETVTVSELIDPDNVANYDVSGIVCSAGSVGWSGLETDTGATVSVSAADIVSPITCTITNTAQRGTIVIVKNTAGGDGTFDFSGDWEGADSFQLTTSGGTDSTTYDDVLVLKQGGYTIVETDPTPAFDGTNVTCAETNGDDGSGPAASSDLPLTGTIDLDDDETVTCTFTNTARSTIVIVKDAQPNADQNFTFATTGLATQAFTLDDDGDNGNGVSNTFNSGLVPANGTYSVTEGSTFGWTLSQIVCSVGGTPNIGTRTVNITPAPGTTVTCTFVNTANPAGLTAIKQVANQVGPWGPFTFELSGGTFSGEAEQNVDSNDPAASWTDLVEGQMYTLVEHGPVPGYQLGTFTCQIATGGDPSPLADADAQLAGFQFVGVAGAQYQCEITNTAISPTLVVEKTTVGGTGTFTFDVTPNPADGANAANPAVLTATTSAAGVAASSQTSTLMAGEGYAVTEQAQDEWIAGTLTCAVTHADDQTEAYAFNTPTLPGDEITCSITNTKKATITVQKQTTPAGSQQQFGFEASWDGEVAGPADFTLLDDGEQSSGLIVPGVPYSVEELATPGWTLTGVTCRGQVTTHPVSITPLPGENVLCVFSNSQLGEVTVSKVANPDSIARTGTTYTVSYTIEVSNASFVDEEYDLSDTPAFASGVTIESMIVNGPGVTNLDLGADGGDIVVDGTIAARTGFDDNDPLVFTVVATFTIAGDTSDRECDGAGSGTFNTATVVFDSGSGSSSDCVSLPSPVITVDKAVKVTDPPQPTHVDGNTYQAVYTVTVRNTGEGPGVFNAVDAPAFGDGATVVSTVPALVGPIVLNAGAEHSYDVTVTFTVAGSMTGAERECGEVPTAGEGAYNLVTVTFNGGQDTGEACVDIPEPDISVTKVATTDVATHVIGDTYEAVYTVTVTNSGDGPGQYDLVDLPEFGAGATVTDIDPEFVNDVDINAGEIDVYTVTVTFTVDGSMTTEERECGEVLTPGQGAFNGVTVSFNDGGSDQDADCIDIPAPNASVTKSVTSATRDGSGLWTIVYDVVVSNSGDGVAALDVNDALQFGGGVTINSVVAATATPGVTPRVAFNGTTDTLIAPDVTVFSHTSRTFTVTVTARIDAPVPGQGACDPEGTEAGGFLNTVTLRSARTGEVLDDAFACAPFSTLTLVKNLVNNSGGTATLADFVLTAVANGVTHVQGTGTVTAAVPAGTYTLAETAKAGYASSGFSCSTGETGSSVTVPVASAVTCTITNDDAPVADLAIVKSASVPQIGAGGGFTWLLDVTNNGPDPAVGVVINDIVPGQVTVTGVTSAQFSCSNSGNTVTCTKPSMAVGETGAISIAVTVPAAAASGTVTNIGTVTATTPDNNTSNNSDDASVTVVAQAPPPPPTPPPVILPPTGSSSTTPVTWAAISLVLIGGVVMLVSRRRRDHTSVD